VSLSLQTIADSAIDEALFACLLEAGVVALGEADTYEFYGKSAQPSLVSASKRSFLYSWLVAGACLEQWPITEESGYCIERDKRGIFLNANLVSAKDNLPNQIIRLWYEAIRNLDD